MLILLTIPIVLYGAIVFLAYFYQEKLIFHPEALDMNHSFKFKETHEEVHLPTQDNHSLHALLFEREENNQLVVYYHGNAGNLEHWGQIAPLYLNAGFNIIIYDYRGFGKSTGEIENQSGLLSDAQLVYDYAKSKCHPGAVRAGLGTARGQPATNWRDPRRRRQ